MVINIFTKKSQISKGIFIKLPVRGVHFYKNFAAGRKILVPHQNFGNPYCNSFFLLKPTYM